MSCMSEAIPVPKNSLFQPFLQCISDAYLPAQTAANSAARQQHANQTVVYSQNCKACQSLQVEVRQMPWRTPKIKISVDYSEPLISSSEAEHKAREAPKLVSSAAGYAETMGFGERTTFLETPLILARQVQFIPLREHPPLSTLSILPERLLSTLSSATPGDSKKRSRASLTKPCRGWGTGSCTPLRRCGADSPPPAA